MSVLAPRTIVIPTTSTPTSDGIRIVREKFVRREKGYLPLATFMRSLSVVVFRRNSTRNIPGRQRRLSCSYGLTGELPQIPIPMGPSTAK